MELATSHSLSHPAPPLTETRCPSPLLPTAAAQPEVVFYHCVPGTGALRAAAGQGSGTPAAA